MAIPISSQNQILDKLHAKGLTKDLSELKPITPPEKELPARLPKDPTYSAEAVEERRKYLKNLAPNIEVLFTESKSFDPRDMRGHIENFIGFAQVPIGVIGPLRVRGLYAQGDYFIPLATNEGALVASFNRGAHVISQSGGASVACINECVSRAPVFQFENLADSCLFSAWVCGEFNNLKDVVTKSSNHCRLQNLKTKIIGKEVYIILEYTTGDASGQNMVTIASDKVCEHILQNSIKKPLAWHIDGNLSGDKKATMISFSSARGKKVVAEVIIPRATAEQVLHVTPEEMHAYWQLSFMGGSLSGAIGSQGHFANGLSALFIACGQDAACVSEASVGITRIDVTSSKDLYISVTLPNLIVGTVGGGTALGTAKACLEMINCSGAGNSQKFAEICASTILAGEISMIAALTSGDFTSAHEKLGRKSKDGK